MQEINKTLEALGVGPAPKTEIPTTRFVGRKRMKIGARYEKVPGESKAERRMRRLALAR